MNKNIISNIVVISMFVFTSACSISVPKASSQKKLATQALGNSSASTETNMDLTIIEHSRIGAPTNNTNNSSNSISSTSSSSTSSSSTSSSSTSSSSTSSSYSQSSYSSSSQSQTVVTSQELPVWIDNDIRAGSIYMAQKSCVLLSAPQQDVHCPEIAGWGSFRFAGRLYARSCINGGRNPRWVSVNGELAYYCEPPAGYTDLGIIQPFTIHKGEIQLLRDGPSDWSPHWSAENSPWWNNTTGKTLVLRSFSYGLDTRGSGLANAASDVCVNISLKAGGNTEALCINQWIGPAGGQWLESSRTINFPGRGLVIPPGGAVYCNTHIAAYQSGGPEAASVFACDLNFADAQDPAIKSLYAYQPIRMPYFDEFTYTGVSHWSPYMNPSQSYLEVNGVWIYASTNVRPVNVFFGLYEAGATLIAQSSFTHGGSSDSNHYSSQMGFSPFHVGLKPGDVVAAQCTPTPGAVPLAPGEAIDCAFYMMLSVREDANGLHPLGLNELTIPWQSSYCQETFNGTYSSGWPGAIPDYNACMNAMKTW